MKYLSKFFLTYLLKMNNARLNILAFLLNLIQTYDHLYIRRDMLQPDRQVAHDVLRNQSIYQSSHRQTIVENHRETSSLLRDLGSCF